jgi:undecaprenyl-diphosphatase
MVHADRAARAGPVAGPEIVPPPVIVPAPVAVRRGRRATNVAIAGVAGFLALLVLVRARRTDALDLAVTLRLQAADHPSIRRLMTAASWPGFPPQSRLIPPMVMLGLWVSRLRLEAMTLLAGWGSALLSTVIKAVMRRSRPMADDRLRVVAAPLGGSSFPSGHVLTYVGVYGTSAYLAETLVRPRTPRRLLVGALLGLVALVGPSRIQQGHHWPTDVAASYLLGTAYVTVLIAIYRRVKARRIGMRP